MPIDFHDDDGLRWSVATPDARSDGPSHATLVFVSESGERRTSEAWLPTGATLEDVEERTWCAFLRYSHVTAVDAESLDDAPRAL